jgi:hypothetical protein
MLGTSLGYKIARVMSKWVVDFQTRGQAVLLSDPIGDRTVHVAAKAQDARTMQVVHAQLNQGWEGWNPNKH